MLGDLIIIAIPCSAFCGLLAIGGAGSDYITCNRDKAYRKWYRHRHDRRKILQAAEMAAIAQPYLKEKLKNAC